MPTDDGRPTRRRVLTRLGASALALPALTSSTIARSPATTSESAAAAPPATSTYKSTLRAIMEEHDIHGVSVAVVPTNGARAVSPIFRAALGDDREGTDDDSAQPLRTEHRLRLASVTKTLTSAAVLRLIDRGKLAPSDVVFGENGLLPPEQWGQPDSPCPIQVRHLLNHQYRVREEQTADWTRVVYRIEEAISLQAMVRRIHEEYTVEIPRAKTGLLARCDPPQDEYYNYGYGVLAAIVDTVIGDDGYDGGRDFVASVKQDLLEPAGAQAIGRVATEYGTLENEAYHHSEDGDPYASWLARHRSWGWSGWAATPLAIARFGQYVASGGPFSPATIETISDLTEYGWDSYRDGEAVGHDGSQVGIMASLRVDPYRTYCVLINTRHKESWNDATPHQDIVDRTDALARDLV